MDYLTLIMATSEVTEDVSKLASIIESGLDKIIEFGYALIEAVIVYLVGRLIIRLVRNMVKKAIEKSKMDSGVEHFLDSIIKVLGYVIIVIVICGLIGIETTSLITVLGSAGLAVGLALQGCLTHFAGGVLILIVKPFKEGDYIKIAGQGEGTVVDIDIIYTTLRTKDNDLVKIPNGSASGATVTTVTTDEFKPASLEITVCYDEDIDRAKDIAMAVIKDSKYYLSDKANSVSVKELSDNGVKLGISMTVKGESAADALCSLNENIKKSFDRAGISIAHNQLDVHVLSEARA